MGRNETAAEALADVLNLIDNSELEATTGERAYITGALHGLTSETSDAVENTSGT